MKHRIMKRLVVSGWIVSVVSGCGRDAPPEVPAYKTPAALVFEESTVPEPLPLSGNPVAAPKPALPPMPAKVQASISAVQKVAAPVAKAEPSAPSLIGTWLAAEMTVNGQPMPMAPGMQIMMTFAEGGSMTTKVSAPQMPEGKTDQGSYTLSNDQITMTSNNHARTGTIRFEDPNRVTLEMAEGNSQIKIVLTRM